MLYRVLKATVRGSGQSPHAGLLYGLTSTKQKSASARGSQIVTDRIRVRQCRKRDFIPRGWRSPAMTTLTVKVAGSGR